MAKKDVTIAVEAQWLEPEKLKLPRGGSIDEALEIIDASVIDIDFAVIVPKEFVGDTEPEFDFRKNAELKALRKSLETRVAESFALVIEQRNLDKDGDVDAYDAAKKIIDSLNSYLDRTVGQLRQSVRAAIAKSLDGKVKADQLQTIGRVDFEKYELRAGVFENEILIDSPMLDLDKALKRKKWQQFGIAWKAGACVVSVKPKKEFKDVELKELRDAMPDGSGRGAKIIGGRFKAESGTKVIFEFPATGKMPKESLLRHAMKEQSGQAVHVTRIRQPPTPKDPKAQDGASAETETAGKTGQTAGKSGQTAKTRTPQTTPTATKSRSTATTTRAPGGKKTAGGKTQTTGTKASSGNSPTASKK